MLSVRPQNPAFQFSQVRKLVGTNVDKMASNGPENIDTNNRILGAVNNPPEKIHVLGTL